MRANTDRKKRVLPLLTLTLTLTLVYAAITAGVSSSKNTWATREARDDDVYEDDVYEDEDDPRICTYDMNQETGTFCPRLSLSLSQFLYHTRTYSNCTTRRTTAAYLDDVRLFSEDETLDDDDDDDFETTRRRRDDVIRLVSMMEQGRNEEAMIMARNRVQKYPQSAIAMSLLGISLAIRRSDDLAEQAFERAAFLADTKWPSSFSSTSSFSFVEHCERQRVQDLTTRLRGSVYFMLGRVRWSLDMWNEAVNALDEATTLYPVVQEGYEWLARSYDRIGDVDRFLQSWRHALVIDPGLSDRYVWPIYCVGIELEKEEKSRPQHHPIAKRLSEERSFAKALMVSSASSHETPPSSSSPLSRFLSELREMECSATFIKNRNVMIRKWLDEHTTYTWTNFAYGQVYFPGWYRVFFERPVLRDAMESSSRLGLDYVALGSNVGTETLYAALTFPNLRAVGYDLMCPFVDIAENMRARHDIKNARFLCQDALKADLGNAGVVFVDNQAWDETLMGAVWKKMNAELPPGSVVFEYNGADYYAALSPNGPGRRWTLEACVTLDVSWYPRKGTHAAVYRKRAAPLSGNYVDWYDYGEQLRMASDATVRMNASMMRKTSSYIVRPSPSYPTHLTTRRVSDRVMESFHRTLFRWHLKTFDMLHDGDLFPEEMRYIETFFRNAGAEHRNFQLLGNWTGNRMSSYSYSHRVRNGHVDSSRFRFGTTSQSDIFINAARPVLRRRQITEPLRLIDDDKNVRFYGLGWDRSKQRFKVYLMIHNLEALAPRHLRLLHEPYGPNKTASNAMWSKADLLPHALLSFTYDRHNKLYEEKVYVYPRTVREAERLGAHLPDDYYVSTVAIMYSSLRGMVSQIDIDQKWSCVWRRKLSVPGRDVIDTYMDVGLGLETLAIGRERSGEDYTLYFPAGSG